VDFLKKAKIGKVKRIGKYDVTEVLGRGGMGIVYRAIDKQIGREVAIKTLTENFSTDPKMLERFYEEGRRTGRLNHPNIVTVYDLGVENGTPYIVMECVQGSPLDKVIASGAVLSLPDRLCIVQQICSALGYAHANKVIHRDVKPSNIFVLPDGKAKLLDFGIAHLEKRESDNSLTRTGQIMGTIPYMAPERLLGKKVDGRSDIFATGVVLYQLVAEQLPFTGTDQVLVQQILYDPHPPLPGIGIQYPAVLEAIIDRALAKAPHDRYSSAEEMAADLANVIDELRHGQFDEMLAEAQGLVNAQEFLRARGVLYQLLKIDNKHPGACDLMAVVDGHFSRRKREERVQQVRQQVEDDLSRRRYTESISILEGNQELFESNPELQALRERAQKEKEVQDRVNEQLVQAEAARRRCDYQGAMAAAQRALELDRTNPKIIALQATLTREAERAERQARAKPLLNSARTEIGSRRYNEALEFLRQAEQLDPTNPEVVLLRGDASSGLEQAQRREEIARLEAEVELAQSQEDLVRLSEAIESAVTRMPSEPALLRFGAQIERQLRELENRRVVEETLQACRNLAPRDALAQVQQARQRVPADSRLLELEALLTDRLRQQSVDERRADYLARAREALGSKQYSEATRILELAHAESLATGELLALLDFARSEQKEHARQDRLGSDLAHAQSLIANAEFAAAIGFLEESIGQSEDPALRLLLDQASAGHAALRQQVATTLASSVAMVEDGKLDDAIEFLLMQPKAVLANPRVQTALSAIDDQRCQAVFRVIGRAYAALPNDISAGAALVRQAAVASAVVTFGSAVTDAFHRRGQDFADSALDAVLTKCKTLLKAGDKSACERLLGSVSSAVPFASVQLKDKWERMRKKTSSTNLLFRMRN
jgi:serine/threonine protein kinase